MILVCMLGFGAPASAESPSQAASEETDDALLTIHDFFVEGNYQLPPDRVDAILAPFIGPTRRFSDIEAARAALEKAYRQLGYPTVSVTVPEQTVEYGVITLAVHEGRLSSIDVIDTRFFSNDYIRSRLPAIRLGGLLHEPTVVKQLDALNANPDLKVLPILKPAGNPEQLHLDLKVKDKPPVHGKVELNNRGVVTTPNLRLNAALQYTNLFDADHALTFQTSQTPEDFGAVQVYSGNYVVPLGAPDHQLVFYGATAQSRANLNQSPLPVGGGFNVIGNSIVAGGRYLLPLHVSETIQQQISFGIDYKRLGRSELTALDGVDSVTVSNAVAYTPASIGYTGTRPDARGFTRFGLTARGYVAGIVPQGDKEDFGGDPNDPLEKPGLRRFSSGTFVVVKGGVDRLLTLPHEASFSARVDGQWASEPLIPLEQYFAGGLETVRGYREFEAVGDNAVHTTLELVSPPIPKLPLENLQRTLRLAVFYDFANLWIKQPLPGQAGYWDLQGTGIGIRGTISDYLRFRYDAAWALRPGPFTPAGSFYGHFVLEAVF